MNKPRFVAINNSEGECASYNDLDGVTECVQEWMDDGAEPGEIQVYEIVRSFKVIATHVHLEEM